MNLKTLFSVLSLLLLVSFAVAQTGVLETPSDTGICYCDDGSSSHFFAPDVVQVPAEDLILYEPIPRQNDNPNQEILVLIEYSDHVPIDPDPDLVIKYPFITFQTQSSEQRQITIHELPKFNNLKQIDLFAASTDHSINLDAAYKQLE